MSTVKIGNKVVGKGNPAYIIGEIGINHNGDIEIAKKLIEKAKEAGMDAVKFQKRTPEICVPEDQKSKPRDTPWGTMTYFEYKKKIEFEEEEYKIIDEHCKKIGIDWFASAWDVPSVEFLNQFDMVAHKVASACLTDDALLTAMKNSGKPVILSTGMSTIDQIEHAIGVLGKDNVLIAHSTSAYPCENSELNLRMINTLEKMYPEIPVGYSGHDKGIQTTVAAVVMGATHIERHITLGRTMWGTDHAASLEPKGMNLLVRDIRICEEAMGDGVKKVYDSEIPIMKKLRNN